MLRALARLGVGLQAVAKVAQQPRDGPEADPVAQLAQAVGEVAHALGRPAQGLLGIAPAVWVHQALEILEQRLIGLGQSPAPTTRSAHPPRRERLARGQLQEPLADRALRHPRSARDRRDPTASGRASLGRSPQPPPPLIELARQRPEPIADRRFVDYIHIFATNPNIPSRCCGTSPKCTKLRITTATHNLLKLWRHTTAPTPA